MTTLPILTREEILGLKDITLKLLVVPATIPVWGGRSIYIKQLTRGEQDAYLTRQFGNLKMKQDTRAKQQELSGPKLYGHDPWLVCHGACDAKGELLFSETDIEALAKKSGEAIGWIAKEILEFSGMSEEARSLESVEAEVKNSSSTQTDSSNSV